ncbi:MAG: metal-sensitive transcriptional regulator [Anaerolineaceae bacterium]|nr:metal-sensitive transcriptional regulator [Anaerolineaceae bacterium]
MTGRNRNHMQLTDSQAKDKLINRLHRIEGQVRGVQSMISDERNCRDILQQLSAIRSAVQGVSLLLLEDYMADCFVNLEEKNPQERDDLLKDLIQMLGKTP